MGKQAKSVEVEAEELAQVSDRDIFERLKSIPDKRIETLHAFVRRQIEQEVGNATKLGSLTWLKHQLYFRYVTGKIVDAL